MRQTFFNGKFYPHNFMLGVSRGSDPMPMLSALADEAKALSPDSFNGKEPMFVFEFRYMPPYEENLFKAELRRLQFETRKHTRFQNVYKGIIVFDCGEWDKHVEEEWFDRMLQFISSMSDSWCSVFLFGRLTEQVKNKLGEYIWVKELDAAKFNRTALCEELSEYLDEKGKKLQPDAKTLVKTVFPAPGRFSAAEGKKIAADICCFFGNADRIDSADFADYAICSETLLNSLLSKDELVKINTERGDRFNVAC